MLKIDSSKIMICQMPVISGPQYNGQSLVPRAAGGCGPAEPT